MCDNGEFCAGLHLKVKAGVKATPHPVPVSLRFVLFLLLILALHVIRERMVVGNVIFFSLYLINIYSLPVAWFSLQINGSHQWPLQAMTKLILKLQHTPTGTRGRVRWFINILLEFYFPTIMILKPHTLIQ